MDKIRRDTGVKTRKKIDDQDADAEVVEGTDLLTLEDIGGYYDLSSDYFFLEVPPNAVKTPVKIKYKVDPCRCQPPMAGITTFVNYFLEMSSNKTVELSEPITVTLMHSGPGIEYGYETTVMTFNQDKYVWEELEEVKQGTRISNVGKIKTDFIQVRISELTILAVVTRLITDRFQVTPKGCVVRSSVCDDVTIEFPEGAVDKTVEGNMKLLLMVQRKNLENNEYGYSCPMLLVDGIEGVGLKKPITITMPHPYPEKYPTKTLNLMRLPNDPAKVVENKWEDITDKIIYKEMKKDQKCFVELQVQHFSWLWLWGPLVALQMLQIIFQNLIFSPPLFVRVGLFKAKDVHRRPVSMLEAFKVTLRCVANHNDRHMKEMNETHEELAVATSANPMQPGDKALVRVEGDFKEKGQRNENEKSILRFLGDEKFDIQLNVCRRNEDIQNGNGRERELIISLYKEIDEHFLCKLSTGETVDTEETLCRHRVYKMRRTSPKGYFVIINVNNFDLSTGLPERTGSGQDVRNFESVFKDLLGFETLLIDNPNAQRILDTIYDISRMDFSNYDCFGLCVMSHGSDEDFYGSDGRRVKWSAILSLFYKKMSPSLKDKPKLFFLQACRRPARAENDGGTEHIRRVEHDTGVEAQPSPPITYLTSNVQDILVVHSCFKGHESYRNREDGTFFIQSLVKVLKENVNNEDMLSMVTMVTDELTSQLGEKQVPQTYTTLRKKLYFKPEMKFRHFYT